MGIAGLHKEIKCYIKHTHLDRYRGKRVGIDAFAWLHRGSVGGSCPLELCTGQAPWRARGEDAPWVIFCLKMLDMLHQCGAIPVVVFDGCKLPAKNITSEKRRARKDAALQQAHALLREGNIPEAEKKFAQAVDITPEMAQELIIKLRYTIFNLCYIVMFCNPIPSRFVAVFHPHH